MSNQLSQDYVTEVHKIEAIVDTYWMGEIITTTIVYVSRGAFFNPKIHPLLSLSTTVGANVYLSALATIGATIAKSGGKTKAHL